MPKVTTVNTNFSAGELSPRMYGRTDVARYANGAKVIENGLCMIHGGIQRRWGTVFEAAAKYPNKRARLIPFVFNRDQAYILEFGDLYMRVYKPEGQVLTTGPAIYEIATPYTEAMLTALDYTQGSDTMFLWSQSVYPQRLRRFADDNWQIENVPFNPAPFDELGFRPAATLALSAATVGAGRTLTAGAATFLATDVGRPVWAGTGIATITAYTDTTHVTATITTAFNSTTFASTEWQVRGSPQANLTPSADTPVGATITLSLGVSGLEAAKTITGLSWLAGVVTVTIAAHGYASGNTIAVSACSPAGYNGTYSITVINANTFTYSLASDPGAAVTLGTAARSSAGANDGWRAADVGKYVSINSGLVRITNFISTTVVQAEIVQELNTAVVAVANSWTLNDFVWNPFDGYPATGTLYEQRLFAAGSPSYPQTIWASATGAYFDFLLGVADDEALSFTVNSDQVNPIAYLSALGVLVALTYGGEFTMEGGVEKPITPTNVKARPRSKRGCAPVRPVSVGTEELFVQRAGKRVRALAYNTTDGEWKSPDISVLAQHIVDETLVDMSFQQEPEPLLWGVRADGAMAVATFDRDQDVVAWTRQATGKTFDADGNLTGQDRFESVATMPVDGGEQTWVIVNRTIEGATVRYIERLDQDIRTDSAITGTHPTGAKVWAGLDHLEGKTVAVKADGVSMVRQTVVGGQITLSRNALAVEIGLPYKVTIELLPPEVGGPLGSSQAAAMDVGEVYVRVLETIGCTINDQVVSFRQLGSGILDQAPQPYSGLKKVENLGWEEGDTTVVIEHDDPLPFHLLGVVRKFTFNQG